MTKILGIDYGRSKVGIAIGEGTLSEPLKVIRVESFNDAIQKVLQVLQVEQVDKVVVGISEGEMGEESKKFSQGLSKTVNIPVETFDETITSKDAQRLSIEAGVSRKKRHQMEDAYAASLILQNYLDSN